MHLMQASGYQPDPRVQQSLTLTPLEAYDVLFRNLAADKAKLIENLRVLKTVNTKQILSYGDQILLEDRRYVSSAIQLETKDVEWTYRQIGYLLKAKGTTNSKDETNRELLELAGQVEATIGMYLKSLHRLKKIYICLQGAESKKASELLTIKNIFKMALCGQVKMNNVKSSEEMDYIVQPKYGEINDTGWGGSSDESQ